MQEVISRTLDPNAPVEEQDAYELCLSESDSQFVVSLTYIAWSEIDRQMMCEGYEPQYFDTLEQARMRYEACRRTIAERGFIYSDMDPIL